MTLRERIVQDLTGAMKSKDALRTSCLRMVKAAVMVKETEGKAHELDDAGVTTVLTTLVKQRKESIEQFRNAGREDLAAKEEEELRVLEGYLPAAASEAEVKEAVEAAIAETKASTPKEMGLVMKAALAKLKTTGKLVDGGVVSRLVKERLGG
jgi:uncharacterized protein YqeY